MLHSFAGTLLAMVSAPGAPSVPVFPPMALVNQVSFTDPRFDNDLAGCAFLVDTGREVLACTCKHVLWVAKSDPMKGVHFEGTLKEWRMRRKDDAGDFVILGELLNEDRAEPLGPANAQKDWLVFRIKENRSAIRPLKLRATPLDPGEPVFLVGWRFPDREGPQRAYRYEFVKTFGAKLLLADPTGKQSTAPGISGGPVVDAEGRLVGVVSDFTQDPQTGRWYTSPCSLDYLKEVLAKAGGRPLSLPVSHP